MQRWAPGDHIEVRLVRPTGEVLARLPQTVVEDRGDRIVGWLAEGTEVQWWALEDGSDPRSLPPTERFSASIVSARRVWTGTNVLRVLPVDDGYSVLHFWDADRTFLSWYINFERPKRRRPFGLETVDLVLDLVVLPDRTHYWKDEDEILPAIEAGWLTNEEVEHARCIGECIVSDFDTWLEGIGDWRFFRPDPGWPVPPLSDDRPE